ncbi:hypothetical protein EVAR_83800_1 [Eumeta japonica]|uniref:Uncharacterized protein n=1 Tax=Eumeta variegata TaxID=151549 RepID=A0A4C1WFD7_EUMVA|nr:hypothetical protein EVAR_83800_1 [Eumeta japonica]
MSASARPPRAEPPAGHTNSDSTDRRREAQGEGATGGAGAAGYHSAWKGAAPSRSTPEPQTVTPGPGPGPGPAVTYSSRNVQSEGARCGAPSPRPLIDACPPNTNRYSHWRKLSSRNRHSVSARVRAISNLGQRRTTITTLSSNSQRRSGRRPRPARPAAGYSIPSLHWLKIITIYLCTLRVCICTLGAAGLGGGEGARIK